MSSQSVDGSRKTPFWVNCATDYNGRMKTLLPNPAVLSLEKIVTQADAITMIVTANRPQVHCPGCRQLSPRVHSRYQRGITDLPWGEITVKLELQTRKFFCDNDECHQRIFCERLPEVVAPYGRQTIRFNRSLTAVGFALGGRAGERLASDLYLPSGARTLLRRIYNEPLSKTERVRILGCPCGEASCLGTAIRLSSVDVIYLFHGGS